MAEGTLPVGAAKASQNPHPAAIQPLQHYERAFDGLARIGQLRPPILHVGLDGRPVFGQRELESHVRVHVAVGEVMDHLPNRPAAFAISCVELRVGESANRLTQPSGSLLDVVEVLFFLFCTQRTAVREFADRETRIAHGRLDERKEQGSQKSRASSNPILLAYGDWAYEECRGRRKP